MPLAHTLGQSPRLAPSTRGLGPWWGGTWCTWPRGKRKLITHAHSPPPCADISGNKDSFDYSLTAIQCSNFVFGAGDVAFQPPSDLALSLSGIGVSCTANWHFNLAGWPHFPSGSGNLDASVSSTTAAIGVALSASNLRPSLTCPSASLSIGNIDIQFHGDNALDWLLDLFKGLIENAVKSSLGSAFGPLVASFVNEDGNAFLASIPITVPIAARAPYNISSARFGFVAPPLIAPTFMGIAVQGDVVPTGFAGIPPIPAPSTPPFNASDGAFMVEGRFSAYTLLSAAWTYSSASLLQWALPSAALPLGLNTTAAYALIAPGLPKAYPGAAVSLNLSVGEGSPIAIAISPLAAGGIQARAVLEMDFLVQQAGSGSGQVQAFSLLANTSFALGVGLRPDAAHPGSLVFNGTLAYLSSVISLGNSSVGPVAVGLLQGLADLVLVRGGLPARAVVGRVRQRRAANSRTLHPPPPPPLSPPPCCCFFPAHARTQPVIVASVNGDLSKGFPLPPIPGLSFTNATALELDQGFAAFKADFTFAPS